MSEIDILARRLMRQVGSLGALKALKRALEVSQDAEWRDKNCICFTAAQLAYIDAWGKNSSRISTLTAPPVSNCL